MALRARDEKTVNQETPWIDDRHDRKSQADELLQLVNDVSGPISIRIEAPYGSGKSFFLNRLAQQAKKDGHVVVEFNAWEEDLLDDPLPSVISSIIEAFETTNARSQAPDLISSEKVKSLYQSIGPILLRMGGMVTSRAIFGDSKALIEVMDEFTKNSASLVEKEFQKLNGARQSLQNLKSEIRAMSETLNGKEIIILVDELDRCKPIFAIRVLEVIKHIFNEGSIVFIVAVDKSTIHSIIEKCYGPLIDKEGYLERYFGYKFNLKSVDYSNLYVDSSRRYDWNERRLTDKNFEKIFILLFENLNINLRESETLLNEFDHVISILCERNNIIKIDQSFFVLFILVIRKKIPNFPMTIFSPDPARNSDGGILVKELNSIFLNHDSMKLFIAARFFVSFDTYVIFLDRLSDNERAKTGARSHRLLCDHREFSLAIETSEQIDRVLTLSKPRHPQS